MLIYYIIADTQFNNVCVLKEAEGFEAPYFDTWRFSRARGFKQTVEGKCAFKVRLQRLELQGSARVVR
jgi:hypothetical protein